MGTFNDLYGFVVNYLNEQEAIEIATEIFDAKEYTIGCATDSPRILDCGSHIGLATLYFKSLYPKARITCVEPVKDNFELLKKNVASNSLEGMTLINAAVADVAGKATMYGEFNLEQPRYIGGSLFKNWANPWSVEQQVDTVVLSSLLQERFDFVKLDLEGMETRAMREAESYLTNVGEICIEYHDIGSLGKETDLDAIIEILERNGFVVDVNHKVIKEIFPENLFEWVDQNALGLATIHAKNKNF